MRGSDTILKGMAIMKKNLLISIIILHYNRPDDVRLCIDSIKRHTPENYELLVVDNGSTNASAKAYLRSERAITLIDLPENINIDQAGAKAMALAKGDYLVGLTDDTLVTPGWLSRFLFHADNNPQIGIIGPRSNFISGPQMIPDARYNDIYELDEFARQWSEQNDGRLSLFTRLVGFCIFFRREVINEIGWMDTSFGFGFDDDDFCMRANLAGFKTAIAQDVLIHHTGGPQMRGDSEYNKMLIGAWDKFKVKWGFPPNTPYGQISHKALLRNIQFDPVKHYTPLPDRAKTESLIHHYAQPAGPAGDVAPAVTSEDLAACRQALVPGQTALEQNDFDGAVKAFSAVAQQYPDIAAPHAALGNLLQAMGHLDEAVGPLRRAVELTPYVSSLPNQLGRALYCLGRLDEAEAAFNQAHLVSLYDVEALLNLIDLYRGRNRLKEMLQAIKQALFLDPKNPDVLVAYGMVMLDTNNLEGAEMAWGNLQDAPQNHPGVMALLSALVRHGSAKVSMQTLLDRVETAQQEEDWARAITLLKSVMGGAQGTPAELAGLWNRLGYSHFRAGNMVEALVSFNGGLDLDPDNLDILGNLAQLYYQQEQFDKATQFINRVLKIDPYDQNTLMLLGNCAIQLGVLDTALMAFRRVQEVAPETEGINDLVRQLAAMQNGGGADLAPEAVDTAALLDQVDAAMGEARWADAIALLQPALQANLPTDERVLLGNRLGVACFQAGQLVEATQAFTDTLDHQPDNPDALSNLASLYLQQETYDKGTEYLNRALKINPDDVSLLLTLGDVSTRLEAFDVALMAFQKVQSLAPDTEGVADVIEHLEALV